MENQLKDSIVVYFLNSLVALAALGTVIYTIMIPGVDAGLVAVVSSISTLIGKTVLDIMMSQSGAEKEDPMTGVAKEMIMLLKEQQNKEETMGLDVSKDRVSIHKNGMSVNTERGE
jgi:parvulin-like peptidyl-prolyl isomerase